MTTAIAFPANSDLSGLHLEQNERGYVFSPWWTFSLTQDEKDSGTYNWGSRYHTIVEQSKAAFASLLGIRTDIVMVTEKKMEGELWWRLSTPHPVAKLKRPTPTKPTLPENRGAIDI